MAIIGKLNLDLLGVILSIFIPLIAYIIAKYYSKYKRKSIERIISEMDQIDNLLDLEAYFDSSTADAVIGGDINQAQMDFLRTKMENRKEKIKEDKMRLEEEKVARLPSHPPPMAKSVTDEDGYEWTEFRNVKWWRKEPSTEWEKYDGGKQYAAPRRARDAFDCPTCGVQAGENCIGISGTEYPWPSSKVHSARLKLLTELESTVDE